MLVKLLIFIVWFLLLYAFSHEEKISKLAQILKTQLNELYWGKELLKCRELQTKIVFNEDLSNQNSTAYQETINRLMMLKSEYGEDIRGSLLELSTFLEEEIETRSKLRQVFGESLFQMVLMAGVINAMSLSFDYFLETKARYFETLFLNLFMLSGGLAFRTLFSFILDRKIKVFISAFSNLNQFIVLAGVGVSSNEISTRMGFQEFESAWRPFPRQRVQLLRALRDWNDRGRDPRIGISHISNQLKYEFKLALSSFKKNNEAVKLLFLILFFLIPYFYIFSSKLMSRLLAPF